MKKSYQLLSSILFVSSMLSACGASGPTQVTKSSLNREKPPSVAGGDLQTLVDGNNTFALDIYRALHSENGNLILSPYSMSLALAMTYAGARGETESQMENVLHFTQGQKTHSTFNALDQALERDPGNLDKDQEPLKLKIANAVWAEQSFAFLPEFLDTIALNYGAGVNLADFKNNFDQERIGINHWVSDKTEDRINDLLPDGSLSADTRMVLVNAIYFKADWHSQFDANSTHDADFHLLDGSVVTAPTMNDHRFGVPYVQGEGYQAIELTYAGETAAMDIILPDAGNFEAFESSFNRERYDEVITSMQPSSVISISLPKFEFTKDFGLAGVLSDMGMKDAFDRDTADFSGMTGKRDLFISDVIHKAFVAVDEEGTEAAAATAVIMEATGAMMPDASFVADRPFIFIIRDTTSGQVLFIGRVLNPAK